MFPLALLVTLVAGARAQCSDNQTSLASNMFKDCMDQRQAALLQTNLEAEPGLSVFCDGLEQFSEGCQEVARCRGSEGARKNKKGHGAGALEQEEGPSAPSPDASF